MATRLPTTGLFLATAALVAAGCTRQAPAPAKQPPPTVTVARPVSQEVLDYFEYPGQVWPVGEVEIRARVSGYINRVNFRDGQEVKEGDVLFEIDPRPYQAALDRALGELQRNEAILAKFQAKLKREERLRPQGAVSQEDYEDDIAQVGMAQASIQAGKAAVRDAHLNLEFTRVVAPISGQVSRARVTEGNLVQPGSGDAAVLTTVVTLNPVYVYFNVEESVFIRYAQLVPPSERPLPGRIKELGIPVEIGLPNEQGFPHKGVLDFVDNRVNTGTGTIRVRGLFENSPRYLTPGLYVRVRLPYGQPHPALLVAEHAIGTNLRQKFVMVVNDKNVAEYRPVELGSQRDRMRIIQSGITPNDLVIVKGLMRAKPGTLVSPHFEQEASSPPASLTSEAGPVSNGSARAR